MKGNRETLLDDATRALKADVPEAEAISASAARTARMLGIEADRVALDGAIESCDDVRRLLGQYRAGGLQPGRKLLVETHLRDCGACQRLYREGRERAHLNWAAPEIATARRKMPMQWGWATAAFAVLLVTGLVLYKLYWQVPAGVRAEVQSIDGSAYLIGANGEGKIGPGTELRQGTELLTAGNSQAVLRLSDGSVVEVNERSALDVGARGRDMTVSLKRGAVIIQAAQRKSGHLYVRTPDCRIAVTGTVFSVDAGLKGSRVAVLRGTVNVAHAGVHTALGAGEQIATSENLAPEPLDQQFAWSPDREKYVGMLAELANVEHRIAQIPFPQPRYSSDLLSRVPDDTVFYVSIPNLGDFLEQANGIFQDQLNQSPALREWWTKGQKRNPDQLNEFVAKIHDISQYLGDEVVVVGWGQGDHSSFAMVADVTKSGLADELNQQFSGAPGKLTVLDPASLATAAATPNAGPGGYSLVRDHEVVFASTVAALTEINGQLNAGASGFANSDFGQQLAAAYSRGAGIILGANLHAILQTAAAQSAKAPHHEQMMASSGLGDVQYLIAEHRDVNGAPANHLDLQFSGARQRMASWLASPAPIGSLDFVSPNAALVVAALTKDPASIADDLMAMASGSNGGANWSEVDNKLQIDVRNDLIANLGGDFTLALDGPVLPVPSWKFVVEVNNPDALESALERMMRAISQQPHGPKAHLLAIVPSTVDSQQYYAVHDETTGTDLADYTFADGFMVMAPTRALVMSALQTHANSNSLARSASFQALLPRDANENYSSLLYQNLSPVLTPLLSQFSGESADAIRKLAADSRPTVICAWGQDNRIEAASDSRLFGFDFLTLGAVLHSRNKSGGQNVMQ
jgi:hypothetical protein